MIGCGSFARLCHGPAQRRLRDEHPGVRLAACCDSDPASASAYREAFGYERHYADAREMLAAEKPDAAVLAVPPARACAAASAVLGLGIPLLLEKPPGMTLAELGALVAASQESGAGAQVGFNRHYMPVMLRAREILSQSFPAPDVRQVDYEMRRHERWDPDCSTTAIHAIDGALLLARSPLRTARIVFEPQRRGSLEAADVTVTAECFCGTRVRVSIRPVSPENSDTARVDGGGQGLLLRIPISPQSEGDGVVEHRRGGAVVGTFCDRAAGPVDRMGVWGETEAFLGSLRSGAPFSPGLADCRQHVALMEAIRNRQTGPLRLDAA
jgi:predicted dehydrogenase